MQTDGISMCSNTLCMSNVDAGSSLRWPVSLNHDLMNGCGKQFEVAYQPKP